MVNQSTCRRRRNRLTVSGLWLLMCCWPASALAWVQATVDSGAHARWYAAEIHYTIDEDATQVEGVGKVAMEAATLAAFDAWLGTKCELCHDPRSDACAPVHCVAHALGLKAIFDGFAAKAVMGPGCEGGVAPANPCAGLSQPAPTCKLVPNGNQVIVVRDETQWCFSKFTVAMTLVSANQVSGEIADADILLNAAHRAFCDGGCVKGAYDLRNTLTHEVGHFLGLDHSAVPEATMFGGAPPQELIKRDLLDDDQVGICTTYRQVWRAEGCPAPEDAGCCSANAGPVRASPGPAWLLSLAAMILLWRRAWAHAPSSARPSGALSQR